MLPRRSSRDGGMGVMVSPRTGWSAGVSCADAYDDPAAGAGAAGGPRGGLQRDRRRRDAVARPDGAVGAPGDDGGRDRRADAAPAVGGAAGAAPVPAGRPGPGAPPGPAGGGA